MTPCLSYSGPDGAPKIFHHHPPPPPMLPPHPAKMNLVTEIYIFPSEKYV